MWSMLQMMRARSEQPRRELPAAEPWDELKTKWRAELVLQAATWRPELLFPDLPVMPQDADGKLKEFGAVSPDGNWTYVVRRLNARSRLALRQGRKSGVVSFDGDVLIPALHRTLPYTPSVVVMSETPQEALTLRVGVLRASGTVVLGGLGLGWLLKRVCAKPSVKRVLVIEQNRELLDWYGDALCAEQPKVTEVICGDALDHVGKHGLDARYLYDIWDRYGEARRDRRWRESTRQLRYVWGWGDVQRD